MLTWGVTTPQAMIWAKVAGRHGVLATKTGPATRDWTRIKLVLTVSLHSALTNCAHIIVGQLSIVFLGLHISITQLEKIR